VLGRLQWSHAAARHMRSPHRRSPRAIEWRSLAALHLLIVVALRHAPPPPPPLRPSSCPLQTVETPAHLLAAAVHDT